MGALAIALLSLAKVEDAATAMKIAGFFFIIYIYFQSLIFHCFFFAAKPLCCLLVIMLVITCIVKRWIWPRCVAGG